jgi:hypothetical protein
MNKYINNFAVGNAVPCRATALNISIPLAGPTFDIDTHLLDFGNNIDVILGTPWLASLGRVTRDFANKELQYV